MAKLTKEEFYDILHKDKDECDGYELHLKYCWDHNMSKSIFYLTGLVFYMEPEIGQKVIIPAVETIMIPPIY
jgi:hypothetical protein